MVVFRNRIVGSLLMGSALLGGGIAGQLALTPAVWAAPQAPSGEITNVNLDPSLQPCIVFKAPVPGGVSGSSIENDLIARYNDILVANQSLGRFIEPADVVVFSLSAGVPVSTAAPAAKPAKGAKPVVAAKPVIMPAAQMKPLPVAQMNPNATYTIYVMGRRLLTVDQATAKASGYASSRDLSVKWAKQLQQHLPRVCFRPPALPEPHVPANPSLLVTCRLADISPAVPGQVQLWGRTVLNLQGVQADGQTAPEKAVQLNQRVSRVIGRPGVHSSGEVTVATIGDSARVMLGSQLLLELTPSDARVNRAKTAPELAANIAASVRRTLDAYGTVPGATTISTKIGTKTSSVSPQATAPKPETTLVKSAQ